ncbi:MAG: hypothetical protein PHD86_09240 [Kiritimatiellae bacterium]|nr:hypothetical protein [Kiritimatiellia bacterium]
MKKSVLVSLLVSFSFIVSARAYEDWLKTGGEAEESAAAPAPAPAAPREVVPVKLLGRAPAEPDPAPAPVIYYEPEASARASAPSPASVPEKSDRRLMWWEGGSSPSSDEMLESASAAWTAVSDFLDGHLDIGVRMTKHELESSSRPPENAFLGNITKLDGDEDYNMNLFFDVMFIKYVGIEYTSYELSADTYNWNTGTSDGSMEISGPIWSIIGRFPNQTRFTPYAGIGKASVDASFSNDRWWNLGYPTEAYWLDAGSPSTGYRNIRREITVDGDDQNVMFFGCAIRITDWLSADIYYRTMDITLDAHYHRTGAYEQDDAQDLDGEFTLDHTTLGFGLKYVF